MAADCSDAVNDNKYISIHSIHFKKVLRSAASWSVGVNATERSIHTAWVAAIHAAQHYVYVENQFFISGSENRLKVESLFWLIVNVIIRAGSPFREALGNLGVRGPQPPL